MAYARVWERFFFAHFRQESVVYVGGDGRGMNAVERAVNRPILCPKIIGRTPEFAALGLLVEQAKGGKGDIALIAGEAGIGKSRLATQLRALAVVQGCLVVPGAWFPSDLTSPYAPLLHLVRALVA